MSHPSPCATGGDEQCWSCRASIQPARRYCGHCGNLVRWHDWRIVRELGRGGKGLAYLVERTQGSQSLPSCSLSQRAVLKLPLLPQQMGSQEHQIECRNLYLAASLGVAPAPIETSPDGILMEYVPPSSQMQVRERAMLLAGAINRLHNRSLVHRDIKPENIIGTQIIDLGLMVDLVRDEGLKREGTPGYAAPEMYRGRISPLVDAYALGWVLIDWLGGPEPPEHPSLAGYPAGWRPAEEPEFWQPLLEGLLAPDEHRRMSVGLAYHRLVGPWCRLADGTLIGSDLVTVQQWRQLMPESHAYRDMGGYVTAMASEELEAFLLRGGYRLPRVSELVELAVGTRRQSLLRSGTTTLSCDELVSDRGARHCRRFLWQMTEEGTLWGGTLYADQEQMSLPAHQQASNPMVGVRVVQR